MVGDPCFRCLLAVKTSDHRGMRIGYDHLYTEDAAIKGYYTVGRLSMGMRLVHSDHMASPTMSRTTLFCGRGGIKLPGAPSRAKQCISQCFPLIWCSIAAGRQSPEELKRLLDGGDTGDGHRSGSFWTSPPNVVHR